MSRTVSPLAERRHSGWWIAALVVAALLSLAALIPSPFAVERPGPVVDAFGTIETEDGELPVISISGTETYPASGAVNVLSVTVSGSPDRPLSWLELARSWFDPTRAIVPMSSFYPEGVTADERAAANEVLMAQSKVQATAAALGQLGEPVDGDLRVVSVLTGGPAAGILEDGDIILSADAQAVHGLGDLQAALTAAGPGSEVVLQIDRAGEQRGVAVTPQLLGNDAQPRLGVTVTTELEFSFDVDIQLDRIGGPSAGLTFALALTDLLTPEDLIGGLSVSSTGTIDERGVVGPIGGLPQKLTGAARAGTDLFLFPVSNCAELPPALPQDVIVAPVATLDEALTAIAEVRAGSTPAGAERCSTAS